jgi:uncharacterized protein
MNNRLIVSPDLLTFERGKEDLLLANGLDLHPLYIRKGRAYVKRFLETASRLGTYDRIAQALPGDTGLLEMLIEHRIIIGSSPSNGSVPHPPVEEPGFDNKKNMSLYLLVAQSCNMGCVYCLNGRKTYRKEKALMMGRDVAFGSVERALDALDPRGFLEVIFFGGEPLLNWPLVKEIVLHCESLKPKHAGKIIKYHVTSNLSFLPSDLTEWAKRYNMTFLCDVDGPERVHDACRPFKDGRPSHKSIARNVERLAAAGVYVMLRTTVTSLNHDRIPDISKHHKELGGRTSAFVPVNPFNSDEDLLDERLLPSVDRLTDGVSEVYGSKLWDEADLYPFNTYAPRLMSGGRSVQGCGAPCGNTPVIDVNGDVFTCIYVVGVKRFHMGNIMDGTFPDMKILRSLYDHLHVDNTEDCKSCSWRYACSGACPMGRLMVLENPGATERMRDYCQRLRCDYTKKIFELILWERGEKAASGILGHKKIERSASPDMFIC